MEILPFQKRAWAEIDIDTIKNNFNIIRRSIGNCKICCVVKANAYGHGAAKLSEIYEQLGADFLAVSNIEEALQLRNKQISLPILILGYTDPKCVAILANRNISQCVFSKDYAKCLSQCATEKKVDVKIHIKIDTGMGRIGFRCLSEHENDLDSVETVCQMPSLIPEGIFTHFASADEGNAGKDFTLKQIRYFEYAISRLASSGVLFEIHHCSNSAAICDYTSARFDMVRAGIILYGLNPSRSLIEKKKLLPALKLKTIVCHIKNIKKGDSVSYGRTFIADKVMKIATLPIGYADGFRRNSSDGKLFVEINGHFASIVGRICMDQCMVDISDIKDVQIGSIVTVYGYDFQNSVDVVADVHKTINYEILCDIGERIPLVYKENNEVVDIADSIISF